MPTPMQQVALTRMRLAVLAMRRAVAALEAVR
jgi:hypothetical protein